MTNTKSMPVEFTPAQFKTKMARLDTLTSFITKIDEAILGEEPQMRKEYQKLRKLALEEMKTLNQDLAKIANQTKTESPQV